MTSDAGDHSDAVIMTQLTLAHPGPHVSRDEDPVWGISYVTTTTHVTRVSRCDVIRDVRDQSLTHACNTRDKVINQL